MSKATKENTEKKLKKKSSSSTSKKDKSLDKKMRGLQQQVLELTKERDELKALSEESKEDGLNISQLDSLLGNTYVNDLDDLTRKRTNIGFSSYVNSSNVTNSTLQSL